MECIPEFNMSIVYSYFQTLKDLHNCLVFNFFFFETENPASVIAPLPKENSLLFLHYYTSLFGIVSTVTKCHSTKRICERERGLEVSLGWIQQDNSEAQVSSVKEREIWEC